MSKEYTISVADMEVEKTTGRNRDGKKCGYVHSKRYVKYKELTAIGGLFGGQGSPRQ